MIAHIAIVVMIAILATVVLTVIIVYMAVLACLAIVFMFIDILVTIFAAVVIIVTRGGHDLSHGSFRGLSNAGWWAWESAAFGVEGAQDFPPPPNPKP